MIFELQTQNLKTEYIHYFYIIFKLFLSRDTKRKHKNSVVWENYSQTRAGKTGFFQLGILTRKRIIKKNKSLT